MTTNFTPSLRAAGLLAAISLLGSAVQAQPSSSNNVLTGTNVSATTGAISTSLNGFGFVNHGLVGVGRIAATALDNWGESLGSVSGLQVTNWTNQGNGSYAGVFNILPDRGYNGGTPATFSNYASRVQTVDFSFTPYTGGATSGVAQNQFALTYNGATSYKFTYGSGTTTTGLVPDSSTTLGGRTVPYVTTSSGTAPTTTPFTTGTNTINKITVDAEALVLKNDGSGWIGDEYGANVYHFNSSKVIDGVLGQPAATVPNGTPAYSSEASNTAGRRGNQGMEGIALNPAGTKLYGLMQSALVQDSGTGNQGRFNTRLMVWDVSSNGTPSAISAEYVLQLPIGNDTGSGAANRNFAQSEIIAIDDTHILVLARDGNGKGTSTALAPVYKSVLLVDLAAATNIAGTAYDNTGGDITTTGSTLNAGITAVSWVEAVNLLNTAQLGKYSLNVNGGTTADLNSLSEKWEGMSLVPTGVDGEYFLFVANDNDFISGATKMVGLDGSTINTYNVVGDNGLPVQNDTMFLAYRVSLGTSAIPEPSTYAALAGSAILAFAAIRRRRS